MSVKNEDILRAASAELELLKFSAARHMDTNPARVESMAHDTKRQISGIKTVCIYGGLPDDCPTRKAIDTAYDEAFEIWSASMDKQREMI